MLQTQTRPVPCRAVFWSFAALDDWNRGTRLRVADFELRIWDFKPVGRLAPIDFVAWVLGEPSGWRYTRPWIAAFEAIRPSCRPGSRRYIWRGSYDECAVGRLCPSQSSDVPRVCGLGSLDAGSRRALAGAAEDERQADRLDLWHRTHCLHRLALGCWAVRRPLPESRMDPGGSPFDRGSADVRGDAAKVFRHFISGNARLVAVLRGNDPVGECRFVYARPGSQRQSLHLGSHRVGPRRLLPQRLAHAPHGRKRRFGCHDPPPSWDW